MEENEESAAMVTKFSQLAILPPRDFPSDVSKWMKINASPKMELKLMQCCKYFKHTNGFPYMVVEDASSNDVSWDLSIPDGLYPLIEDIHSIPKKLWITKSVRLIFPKKTVSELLLQTAVCNVSEINLMNQQLTMNELKILTDGGNVEDFNMTETIIRNDKREVVSLEDICECLPNARKIKIGNMSPSILSLEAAETKISAKLESLALGIQPIMFDLQKLLAYMKCHQQISYSLTFYGIAEEEYAHDFSPDVEKVLRGWSPESDPPKISVKENLTFSVFYIDYDDDYLYQ